MFKILVVLILTCLVIVEGVPFMKTSFDLGSQGGFCIDIESSGSNIFYNSVLLSSCKQENSEGVLQKILFEGQGTISINGYQRCLEVKPKSGGWDVVFLPCYSNQKAQNFTLVQKGCMIKSEKVEHCLAAGSTVSSNGDSLTRILQVVDCGGVSGELLAWDVHPHSSETALTCSKPRTGWSYPKWAAVIFVVFGLITCWCACWILFCPNFCREKQKQIGLFYKRKSSSKILSDEILRCPAGHEIRAIPNQGKRSCSVCHEEQFIEDTKVYLCSTCDWMVCHSCCRRGRTCAPSAPVAPQPSTPKKKAVNATTTNAISYTQIPIEKPDVKEASLKQQTAKPTAEAPNFLTRLKRNVFGTTEQEPAVQVRENSVASTPEGPERLMAEIDAIRSVVRVVSRMQRHVDSRGDFRSPSDYYYSPCRKRRSRRYSRWSDSLSSTSWSEDVESSPSRRPWRRRKRRRSRRADYD